MHSNSKITKQSVDDEIVVTSLKKALQHVRETCFLGTSNKYADIERTGDWSMQLQYRQCSTWNKIQDSLTKKTSWVCETDREDS